MVICPLCNGLISYDKCCSVCGSRMNIKDRIEDYEDSYSPYLSYNITDVNDGDPPDICSHISVCSNCGYKEIVRITMMIK
jgi:hypothetical protein